ncbi:hypothetical protein [Flavobacterium sp. FlaQc-30]|uniref:hypothetical protein n=1 Tax=Flavobacterium sp. FlaQc-30 TaxID=3374179 RepID=UPI0037570477
MNTDKLNLEELNDFQLENIDGGGFFKDLGVGSRMIWNAFLDFSDSLSDTTGYGDAGYYK